MCSGNLDRAGNVSLRPEVEVGIGGVNCQSIIAFCIVLELLSGGPDNNITKPTAR